MTPWAALLSRVKPIAAKLEALHPPLLVVRVDGETTLVSVWPSAEDLEAHARFPGMPRLTLERRIAEVMDRLAQLYPSPRQSVEVCGQWPGNPPRLEVVAVARRSTRAGAEPAPARQGALA
ncbi:hypothetical protein [Meiothermus rufus]|uniref:hypothetical protein n=1 Tax=Meiothermus rufus TaxID=604332 RepID=UPI00040BB162|nr:hypothetical protein [Meiothermus rufus]